MEFEAGELKVLSYWNLNIGAMINAFLFLKLKVLSYWNLNRLRVKVG